MSDTIVPIKSAKLNLQLPSASVVTGPGETHLVFPAVDLAAKDVPPKVSLSKSGPPVVRVDVHESPSEEEPGGSLGYTGPDRLTVFLPSEFFGAWTKQAQRLDTAPMEVEADVDEDGNVVALAMNGVQVLVTTGTNPLYRKPGSGGAPTDPISKSS